MNKFLLLLSLLFISSYNFAQCDHEEFVQDCKDHLSDEPDNYNLNYYSNQEENNNFQTKESVSFHQFLDNQSKNLILTDSEKPICEFLIGSIDESGYLRREIEDIIDDLAFTQNIVANTNEVLSILEKSSSREFIFFFRLLKL